jgi:hypothetical protein
MGSDGERNRQEPPDHDGRQRVQPDDPPRPETDEAGRVIPNGPAKVSSGSREATGAGVLTWPG